MTLLANPARTFVHEIHAPLGQSESSQIRGLNRDDEKSPQEKGITCSRVFDGTVTSNIENIKLYRIRKKKYYHTPIFTTGF